MNIIACPSVLLKPHQEQESLLVNENKLEEYDGEKIKGEERRKELYKKNMQSH